MSALEAIATVVAATSTVVGTMLPVMIMLARRLERKLRTDNEATRREVRTGFAGINGLLETTLDHLPYPAWIKLISVNENGETELRMQFINKAYAEFFGISKERYRNRTDTEVWGPVIGAAYYSHDMAVYGSRKPVTFTEDVNMPNGSVRTMRFEKTPISNGKYEGVLGFLHDTETRQLVEDTFAKMEAANIEADSAINPGGVSPPPSKP